MSRTPSLRYVRLCAWSGPALIGLVGLFWGVLGQNIPPYSAALDAETFAALFREKMLLIRLGMDGMIVVGGLYMTWGVAISQVMKHIERDNDVLSTVQLLGAALTTMIFIIPASIWLTATFRADTMSPELLQMLYDFGWILFDLAFFVTSLQMIAMGLCFLDDQRVKPLVPKWVAWFCFYEASMLFVELLMPFFKSGPFSRSGFINYWVEFGVFFIWGLVVSIHLFKAITRLEQEQAQSLGNA